MNESDSLNIQGDIRDTQSKNKMSRALSMNPHEVIFLTGIRVQVYHGADENVVAVSLSDVGIVAISVISLKTTVANPSEFQNEKMSKVFLFDLKNNDFSYPLFQEPGVEGYGTSLSLTSTASHLAIGNPTERSVIIYNINRNAIDSGSKQKIVGESGTSTSFGTKIALSDSGNSLAIVDPSFEIDKQISQVIFVYVMDNEGKWDEAHTIVYDSTGENLKLNIFGVAIDDTTGRIDCRDKAEHYRKYLLDAKCSDNNSFIMGESNNMFRPICQCKSGYKSSSARGGNILTEKGDTCDSYNGIVEQYTPPSTSPSSSPTSGPTKSLLPSNIPSLNPTISWAPSNFPSGFPSQFGSVFDGGFCRYDIECRSDTCIHSTCQGKVSYRWDLLSRPY